MPPFGGSFANGGTVPGPVGSPRTIVAHGGERVMGDKPLRIRGSLSIDESGIAFIEGIAEDVAEDAIEENRRHQHDIEGRLRRRTALGVA
jgi:hypothetical protein